jgi:hypothetical protein
VLTHYWGRIASIITAITRGPNMTIDEGFAGAKLARVVPTMDLREGLDAWIERRPPNFKGEVSAHSSCGPRRRHLDGMRRAGLAWVVYTTVARRPAKSDQRPAPRQHLRLALEMFDESSYNVFFRNPLRAALAWSVDGGVDF